VVTYGVHNEADVKAENISSLGQEGFSLNVRFFEENLLL